MTAAKHPTMLPTSHLTAQPESGAAPGRRFKSKALLVASLQIAALAFHVPIAVISGPEQSLVGVSSALKVGCAVAVVAYASFFVAAALSGSTWKALAWVSVALVFFWHWDGMTAVGNIPPWFSSLLLLAICLVAVGRAAHMRYFRAAALATSLAFVATAAVLMLQSRGPIQENHVVTTEESTGLVLTRTPNFVFIVLDAYARSDVLSDLYGYDNSEFIDDLEAHGFSVPDSANSNYSSTHFSVSSMLEMEYVFEPGTEVSNADLDRLADIISGDNELVDLLKRSGYTYVHGDTDHWLNTCGPAVDRCEPGPLVDVTGTALLAGTPIGPWLYPESGDPTTALNRTRLDQLVNWTDFTAPNSGPTFTFLHLVLPHPPLYLDSLCQPHVEPILDGRNMSLGQYSQLDLDTRRLAYNAQVTCANSAVRQLLTQLNPDDVVVITADHGPDSLRPVTPPASETTPEQRWERYATFTAMRFPEACPVPQEDHQLVNTFRLVVACLTERHLPDLDKRYFVAAHTGPVEELKDPDSIAEH